MLNAARTTIYAANYDPYGQVMAQYLPDATPSFGFTGQMTDASGLQYLRARYYDPSLGAFLSQDPVQGVPGSASIRWNPYIYAGGNPTSNIDPDGRCFFGIDTLICAAVVAGAASAGFGWDLFVTQGYGRGGHNSEGATNLFDLLGNAARHGDVGRSLKVGAVSGLASIPALYAGAATYAALPATVTTAGALSKIGIAGAVAGQVNRAASNVLYGHSPTQGLLSKQDLLFDYSASVVLGGALLGAERSVRAAGNAIGGSRQGSFASLMSADDALRYNQYWDDVASRPFASQMSSSDAARYLQYWDDAINLNFQESLGGHSIARHNSQITLYALKLRVLGQHPRLPQSRSATRFLSADIHNDAVNAVYRYYKHDIMHYFASSTKGKKWTLDLGYRVGEGYTNVASRKYPVAQFVQKPITGVQVWFEASSSAPNGFYLYTAYPVLIP